MMPAPTRTMRGEEEAPDPVVKPFAVDDDVGMVGFL